MLLIRLPQFHCKTNSSFQLCRQTMVKEHNCRVKIFNNSRSKMTYVRAWYDSGRLADSYCWPQIIEPGHEADILNYERDWALAGCSGFVTYEMLYMEITIAFSNPVVGSNKLGVGLGGKNLWDNMESHDYLEFPVNIDLRDGSTLIFTCHCTSGTTNSCNVKVTQKS